MQRIEVKNFGPLKDVTLDIKDYMVFIGPQASGKSTLAKLIYISLKIKDIYRETILNRILVNKLIRTKQSIDWYDELAPFVKNLFQETFPTFRYGNVSFIYDDKFRIDVDISFQVLNTEEPIVFSNAFHYELENYGKQLDKSLVDYDSLDSDGKALFNSVLNLIHDQLSNSFSFKFFSYGTKTLNIFVPSGRTIISILSNSITFIENNNLDYYNEEFIKLTNTIREFINTSDYENLYRSLDKIDLKINEEDKFSLANDLMFKILKGAFQSDNNRDTILQFSNGVNIAIPLKYTSSGQQESSWLINTIRYLLAESVGDGKNEYNTVIEEPEAHLFPEAQRDMTYLISLLANQQDSKVLITTHSPYILASLNNLIKAYLVGQDENNREPVGKLIHPLLWINPERLYVGYLENGIIRKIIDAETNLINHDELDGVSVDIMSQFDDLLEIQYDG